VNKDTVSSLDFDQAENYTSREFSGVGSMVSRTKVSLELKYRIKEYLEIRGYEVTEGAELVGKSKVTHAFDMIADMDDGFNRDNMAVCITSGGESEKETI